MDSTVIAAIITTAPALATAALAVHVRRGNAEARRANEVVRAQVANSHGTNLREDVDLVLSGLADVRDGLSTVLDNQTRTAAEIAGIREDQRRTDAEIAGIRADLRVERQERLSLAARLQEAP